MNFDLNPGESQIINQLGLLWESDSELPSIQTETEDPARIREALLSAMSALAESGYLGLGLDDGKTSTALVVAQEAMAAQSPSLFLGVEVSTRIFGRLIATYGTPEQKARILEPLQAGRMVGAVALSEGGMNIENDPLETTALFTGPEFRVSGEKAHVVNGPIADWFAVAGTMAEPREGIAFFLMQAGHDGLRAGRRFSTLGFQGTAMSALSLQDCPVPPDWVMGPFEGRTLLDRVRLWEDQILSAASLGLMQRSVEAATAYAKSHTSGGRPIIAFQEVGFTLAEMLTLLQTSQLLAYRAAWMDETGNREATAVGRCAKVFCSESAEQVASKALQILGGQGYLNGNLAEGGYRDAKYLQIAGTSTEISRMKIAEEVLAS
jgi:alkylation response protein AidB-like acyl-CoA dehydrogenase